MSFAVVIPLAAQHVVSTFFTGVNAPAINIVPIDTSKAMKTMNVNTVFRSPARRSHSAWPMCFPRSIWGRGRLLVPNTPMLSQKLAPSDPPSFGRKVPSCRPPANNSGSCPCVEQPVEKGVRPAFPSPRPSPRALGFDDGPIAPAEVAPAHVEGRIVGDRKFARQVLVEVDAQAGPVVGPVVAVLQLGAAGEDVLLGLGELARLPECRSWGSPDRDGRWRRGRPARRRRGRARRCGRRRIRTTPPPCGPCVRPPICDRWMRMKSISRLVNQRHILVGVVEQLAHRDAASSSAAAACRSSRRPRG